MGCVGRTGRGESKGSANLKRLGSRYTEREKGKKRRQEQAEAQTGRQAGRQAEGWPDDQPVRKTGNCKIRGWWSLLSSLCRKEVRLVWLEDHNWPHAASHTADTQQWIRQKNRPTAKHRPPYADCYYRSPHTTAPPPWDTIWSHTPPAGLTRNPAAAATPITIPPAHDPSPPYRHITYRRPPPTIG